MSTDKFVLSYTHLKDRPKSECALPMLQKIASLVKPIMRKHGWVLPVLAEFFPETPDLVGLNVNGGQKILLRLRPAWAPDTFYEEDDVVRTMLHELTHNVHGPHDEKFYKFLSGLEEEYEALRRSGYAGEGFHSKGHRLGVDVSHDLPPHLARAKALEAAEKRRRVGGVLRGGGRLGGLGTARRGMTPRQLAAEAAERRARDEKACGRGDLAQREADKALKESIEDKAIDLTDDMKNYDSDIVILDQPASMPGPSKITVPQSKKVTKPTSLPKPSTSKVGRDPPNKASSLASRERPAPYPKSSASKAPPVDLEWSCPACTLLNEPLALQCGACLSNRPVDPTVGWACMTCGEAGIPHQFWTCSFCGSVKTESVIS